MTPGLTVLIGSVCAGKSYYAAARFSPTEIVAIDHCAHLLDGASWHEARHLYFGLIEQRVRLGLTVCCDATNLSAGSRLRLLEIAAAYALPATAVLLPVPLEVARARNRERSFPMPNDVLVHCAAKMDTAMIAVREEPWDIIQG